MLKKSLWIIALSLLQAKTATTETKCSSKIQEFYMNSKNKYENKKDLCRDNKIKEHCRQNINDMRCKKVVVTCSRKKKMKSLHCVLQKK